MSQEIQNYELLFEGTKATSAQMRHALSMLLESACGFQLIELETALGNTGEPISIISAATSHKLDLLREDLVAAGAKVLIVRSGEYNGPKFAHKTK